jgi:hypothetical protein
MDCGQEIDEQWNFYCETIKEWAAEIREAHTCNFIDNDDERNELEELIDNANEELMRLDRIAQEKHARFGL